MRYDGTSTRRRPRSFSCMPWFIFWRWFNGGETGDSRHRFGERKLEKEKIEGNSDVIKRKSEKMKGGSRNCEASDDVPEISKEASINLGVGFGLIYFVRDEVNKMVELRQNIELLLQEFRKEVQNQDKKSSISSSFSNTCVQEEIDSGQQLSSTSHDAERPGTCFPSDRYRRREKSLRMDQLEAELEAEFDRLQITSDSYNNYSEMNVEDSAPELSLNVCYEEDNGPHEEFYGVSPRELERKLHEVLETRQEERINELESALEYAMQQVEEKERELACWKDAARFVSWRFPAIPGLLRQGKQDVYCTVPDFEDMETGKSLVESSIYGARGI